jgi:hypothetical protein
MEYIDTEQFKEFTVDMYSVVTSCQEHYTTRAHQGQGREINKGITRKNAIVGYLQGSGMGCLPGVIG